VGFVAELRYIVVESDYGPSEKQGRICGICEVIAKREIGAFGWDGDTISF
jgi:hypothetical protein